MSTPQALRILLVDDEPIVRQTLGDYLRESGHRVDEAGDGRAAKELIEGSDHDLALVDVRMPGMDGFDLLTKLEVLRPEMPVAMITGHADMQVAIQALRGGAADFLAKPVKLTELDAVLEKCVRLRASRRDRNRLRKATQCADSVGCEQSSLVGTSPATEQLRQEIRAAVEAKCETILITGETGTGKEVAARELHFQASAMGDPFIAVSCAAFTDSLVESELFGHVKGAFTGATDDRIGCFELADGSTLLLDEVGELSLSAQAKLLRVLETRTLRRVGGAKEIAVNVRVIAATNSPLQQQVAAGNFRSDLFHRLNIYPIELSPLRQRREDILPLAEYFLDRYAGTRDLQLDGFSADAQDKLLSYGFPGNARELRYLVERAAILTRAGVILPEHLSLPATTATLETTAAVPSSPRSDEDQERARILSALENAHWNRRDAAQVLAIPYSTLRYRMQKLGITK